MTHKGRKLHAKTHKEFMDSRHEDNDEFDPEKLLKTGDWIGFVKLIESQVRCDLDILKF